MRRLQLLGVLSVVLMAFVLVCGACSDGTPDATTSRPTPTEAPRSEPEPATPATPIAEPPATPEPSVSPPTPTPDEPPTSQSLTGELTYELLASHPHDTAAFTQGLLHFDGLLFESTGLRGESVLRAVEVSTGEVIRQVDGDAQHFGEGLARVGDRLIWLTWQAETAEVYDIATFQLLNRFTYEGEGWGICHDGQRLVMSDGSAQLTFRDPETFEVLGTVQVTDMDGTPVSRLNELECVNGAVWANVWLTDRIVVVDPATGQVTASADMTGLLQPHPALADADDVLNGIAYLPESDTFLLTGKRWPAVLEVRFSDG